MSQLLDKWHHFEGEALFYYHRIVGRFIRWQIFNKENLILAQSYNKPILWAFWHEQLSPFIMYGDRFIGGENFCLVRLGGDPRGDIILKKLASKMGGESYGVDMQGNPVASGRAVLRVIQALKAGKQSFLAPDGPDGPAFVPKKGVAFLAKKAGAVVIPVGAIASPMLHLNRWDKYQLPLPFSKIHFHLGKPLVANRKDDEADLLKKITNALSDIRYQAQDGLNVARWP
ncbi:MAG: hypothetical protein AAF490_21110 [Chloroflexota bacterium]